eukprot:gnl/MRDRNA2_/MRDRNA2_86386_c1_seq1.p1 gnl/MRDRNA2_/MRDRNA2_86386_c1~~gnl/MRDRNA2_/MRDRNA2_86386_c1_seq1.p1  ORF type:complete len:430 (+),score=-3.50 gnl/MRDRNA2_/MRDRNA2_86386_c1_seq1:3-1292(+)
MNRPKAALVVIKEIIDTIPDFIDAWVSMAVIQETIGCYVDGINSYMVVAYILSNDVILWHQLAIKAQTNHMLREAIECYNWILHGINRNLTLSEEKAFLLWKVGLYNYPLCLIQTSILRSGVEQTDLSKINNLTRWYYALEKKNEAMRLVENIVANHLKFGDLTPKKILFELYLNETLNDDGYDAMVDSDWFTPSRNLKIKNRIDIKFSSGIVSTKLNNMKQSQQNFSVLWFLKPLLFTHLFINSSQIFFELGRYEQSLTYSNPINTDKRWAFLTLLVKAAVCCAKIGLHHCARELMIKSTEKCFAVLKSKSLSFNDLICVKFTIGLENSVYKTLLIPRKKILRVSNKPLLIKFLFEWHQNSHKTSEQIMKRLILMKFFIQNENIFHLNVLHCLKWFKTSKKHSKKDEQFDWQFQKKETEIHLLIYSIQ